MFIEPKLTADEARVQLKKGKLHFFQSPKILKASLVYLPCYQFHAEVETRPGEMVQEFFCVDAVYGDFAFLDLQVLNTTTIPQNNSQQAKFILSLEKARKIAESAYSKHVLQLNLRRKTKAQIKSLIDGVPIFYPYWIGFFKKKSNLDFNVLDAISGQQQGVKMKPVFVKLLLNSQKTVNAVLG